LGTKTSIKYNNTNTGFFGTIFDAWANHLNLRTTPEDWWLPVITRVAHLVDNHADTEPLRKYFVGGRSGKEEIVVDVDSFSIYDTDYSFVFKRFSEEIDKRIHVPDYVSTISSSFSTTTPDQLIGSQITIMKSFQKYFDYTMGVCGCGIKGLEMAGTEKDWILLSEKLAALRKLLAPIESTLQITNYFRAVESIFTNLHKTYMEDPEMDKWWATVLMDCKEFEYGPSGMRKYEVDAYNGWLVHFCNGAPYALKASKLSKGGYKDLSVISTCPMKIIDRLRKLEDNSTLVAGMVGWKEHHNTANGVKSLEPVHGWALLLSPNSPLRSK